MKKTGKPLALALGTAMASSLIITNIQADENPFFMNNLESGYQIAMSSKPKESDAKKTTEGKCGEQKQTEGKCGEGKCGSNKKTEGKCGEGKCGSNKKTEGKCGSKKKTEGKCGEGKCGSNK